MVIIVFAIDMENFYLASGPDVITRGFIYARENEDIINEIKEVSRQKIEECLLEQSTGWQVLKGSVRKSVEVLLFEKTKRIPNRCKRTAESGVVFLCQILMRFWVSVNRHPMKK